jgi:hypothetical protein
MPIFMDFACALVATVDVVPQAAKKVAITTKIANDFRFIFFPPDQNEYVVARCQQSEPWVAIA